jgi:hypothetical protein
MKFRVYNKENITKAYLFPTYFKTKKEAVAYAEKLGDKAVLERKIGGNWFGC